MVFDLVHVLTALGLVGEHIWPVGVWAEGPYFLGFVFGPGKSFVEMRDHFGTVF